MQPTYQQRIPDTNTLSNPKSASTVVDVLAACHHHPLQSVDTNSSYGNDPHHVQLEYAGELAGR